MQLAVYAFAPSIIVLATLSLAPSEAPPRQGLRAEIEALEKLEASVCGVPAGYFGKVDEPIYSTPPPRSTRCRVRVPP